MHNPLSTGSLRTGYRSAEALEVIFYLKKASASEELLHGNSAPLKIENTPKFIWKSFVIVSILAVTNREWLPAIS